MDLTLMPYLLPYLITAWVAATLVVTSLPRWRSPGAAIFLLIQALILFGAVCAGLLILSPALESKLFWQNLMLTSLVMIPTLTLLLVLDLRNHMKWLRPLPVILLLLVPAATLALAWTNPMHNLFWWQARLAQNGAYPTLELDWNLWFWIALGYCGLMLMAALLTLARGGRDSLSGKRRASLAFGIVLPAVALVLDIFNILPLASSGLSAGMVTIGGLLSAASLFPLRVLRQTTDARDSVFQGITTGVIVLDERNRISDLNASARRYLQTVLEAPQQRWVGVDIAQMLKDLPEWVECLTSPEVTFTRLIHGSGSGAVWFDLQATPILDRRQRSRGRVILLQDISERKQVEDTILASEERYRQLLDGAPFPIVITSLRDNSVLYANQRAGDLFEESPGSAIGNPAPAYYANPARRKELLAELQRAGQVSNFEAEFKTGRGRTFWALLSANKIDYLSHPAVFSAFNDISDRKQIEQELKRTLEEMTLFNQAMVGREQRMIELKEEVNKVLGELGRDAKYAIPPPEGQNPR